MIVGFTGKSLTVRQRGALHHWIASGQRTPAGLDAPIVVEVTAELRKNQYSSLWYGGEIANIRYKGWTFELYACGDVYADLYRKGDPEEWLLYVKDKNNAGQLGKELQPYIKTDKALYAAINGQHSKYRLELLNNNWYECFAIDPCGHFYDLMWALDSDHAIEAIAEIIDGMDEVIENAAKETG